ncbi:MAG: hypothetical protein KBA26_03830 [Candidatus Delongbacteria bacterium]|nr:hypothetical protein [Candidatus Delongbacteria bacterium]
MKNPFESLRWAKRACPNCGTLLRFPTHKGNLRITCPHCRQAFVIQFQPMSPIHWKKGVSLGDNIRGNLQNWKQLWHQAPWMIIVWGIALVMLIVWIVRLVMGSPGPESGAGTV